MSVPPSAAAAPLSVLVVDDSAVSRYVLATIVESLGHRCAVADGGEAALAMLRNRRADVVLMDAVMPGLDGFAAARAVRALPAAQQPRAIIGVSATAGAREAAAFRAAGAAAVLGKPVALDRLVAALEAVVAAAPIEG
jgi:CheY-like chemotaxis protein